jgi:hypothetical protein
MSITSAFSNRFQFFIIILSIIIVACKKDNFSASTPLALSSIANNYHLNSGTSNYDPSQSTNPLFDTTQKSTPHLIYKNSFDSAWSIPTEPKSNINGLTNESSRFGAVTLDHAIARSGSNSVKFEYLKNDAALYSVSNPDAYLYQRAELARPSETESEMWYGFSNFFPGSYTFDSIAELVFQWHDFPDRNLGETWRSPPLALITQNDKFLFKVRHSALDVNTNSTSNQVDFDLGVIPKNEWIDWVVHIKFSYAQDGILEIWKNGFKVVNYDGPNCYNDYQLPYFKIGLYKWDWTETPSTKEASPNTGRIIYYDALKIGNKNTTYEEVAPK